MIQTSYFALTRKLDKACKYVSIARYNPHWMRSYIPTYTPFVPSLETLMRYKQNKDEVEYTQRYINENLSKLDCATVYKQLDGCILLCYEAPNKFCHRHIISKWFRENGFDCHEIILPKQITHK